MATSPDINNYMQGGTGNLYWTPAGGVERHLGNCKGYQISPDQFETRDHLSFMGSAPAVDKTSVVRKGGSIAIILDEITPENLAMFLFGGEITTNSAGNKEFEIFGADAVTGALRYVGENGTGSKYTVRMPSVTFRPEGSVDLIGEDDVEIALTGTIQNNGTGFGTIEEHYAAPASS